MPGKVNHRGWIVLTSVSSADGAYCVDLFEDPNGGYGFEHFRSEPEDNGRWTPVGAFGGARFSSAAEAGRAASVAVYWVAQDRRARTMLNDYLGG
jgi:cell wall assembly regulator SMI1